MSGTDNFVLRSTVTSPFGRKVRMAIDVLGLANRIKVQPADPLDAFRQSGYLERITAERGGRTSATSSYA